MYAVNEARELEWAARIPTAAGYYWYTHPAAYEHPVLVRVETVDGALKARFADMPLHVPLRMLAGGRWAGPAARPQ